jgi:hypothetical protein
MENLQEATEKICDLKGNVLALESFLAALIRVLPEGAVVPLQIQFQQDAEAARTMLLHAMVSEHTRAAFERDAQRLSTNLQRRADQLL